MIKWRKSSSHVEEFCLNFTCACRNYLYAGNIPKIGQIGDKGGLQGPSGRGRWARGPHAMLIDPTWALPKATIALATSPMHGSCSRSSPMPWFKSVSTNGQDLFIVDSWAHCHRLGSPPSNYQPTYCQNFDMCQACNHHWEPTIIVGLKGGGMEGRVAPFLGHLASKSLHWPCHCLPIPHMPLYTINRGCEARWKEAPFISMLSKLLLAF